MKWAVPRIRANVKIQNGRQRSTPKTFFFNFYITFLATWGCDFDWLIDFLKMLPLPKFKMAAKGQLQIFFWILQSYSPRYGDVLVIFFKVLLKCKMAAMDQLHIFLWPRYSKNEVINNSHFIITLPTIWKCAGDFTGIQNGRDFLYICDRKNSNLIYGRRWHRTSGLLFTLDLPVLI